MSDTPAPADYDAWHRRMAVDLFNRAWELLDAERDSDGDREMLASALASWLHWRRVGEPKNFSVSDWQVSRVYAVLGDGGRAADHGRESLRWAEENDLGPFYVGYACEALARAAAMSDDESGRDEWLAEARGAAASVEDADSREMLLADLDTV